jgi:hypothetical protein
VYWGRRPFPLAFIVSMQFRYLARQVELGRIRRAVYSETGGTGKKTA